MFGLIFIIYQSLWTMSNITKLEFVALDLCSAVFVLYKSLVKINENL